MRERRHLPGDAGGRDPETLRELRAAQPVLGRAQQLEQERQVAEAQAVEPAEGVVEPPREARPYEREPENQVERI